MRIFAGGLEASMSIRLSIEAHPCGGGTAEFAQVHADERVREGSTGMVLYRAPDIQLRPVVNDDGATAPGAQQQHETERSEGGRSKPMHRGRCLEVENDVPE